MLVQANSIDAIEQFLSDYVKEVEKSQRHSKVWKKVYAFTQFAGPVLEVFKQANFTPECSIALGLVGLLLIQVSTIFSREYILLTLLLYSL